MAVFQDHQVDIETVTDPSVGTLTFTVPIDTFTTESPEDDWLVTSGLEFPGYTGWLKLVLTEDTPITFDLNASGAINPFLGSWYGDDPPGPGDSIQTFYARTGDDGDPPAEVLLYPQGTWWLLVGPVEGADWDTGEGDLVVKLIRAAFYTAPGEFTADALLRRRFTKTGVPAHDPAFVGVEAETTDTADPSIVVNKPAGVVNGDLLLAVIVTGASAGTGPELTGWDVEFEVEHDDGAWVRVLSRTAASEPSSYTITQSPSTQLNATISAYRGVTRVAQIVGHTTVNDPDSDFSVGPYVITGGLLGESPGILVTPYLSRLTAPTTLPETFPDLGDGYAQFDEREPYNVADGVETVFTFDPFVPSFTIVTLNGIEQTEGVDYNELDALAGTIEFTSPPDPFDSIVLGALFRAPIFEASDLGSNFVQQGLYYRIVRDSSITYDGFNEWPWISFLNLDAYDGIEDPVLQTTGLAILLAGPGSGISLDAEITATSFLSGYFTADAWIVSGPGFYLDAVIIGSAGLTFRINAQIEGLSRQQHPRDDTAHYGVDHDVVVTLAGAVGIYQLGSDLQDLLEDVELRIRELEAG